MRLGWGALSLTSRRETAPEARHYALLLPCAGVAIVLWATALAAQSAKFDLTRISAQPVAAGVILASLIVAGLGFAFIIGLQRCHRAEQAARDSERRYRFLAEHSSDMIVRFDPRTQRRTYISPACRRLYGYEPGEALAMRADKIIHPDDLPGVQQALARLDQEHEHPPILYRGRRKDGTYVWVRASLGLVKDPATGATEIVSVVRSADESVRYEEALLRAKEAADAANSSKSRFLATMSHELRTPLNAIIGFADLMRQEVIGPVGNDRYRSYIADIYASGEHLLQLINDILDLTKAEAGKLDLNDEIFELADLIASVVRVNRPNIEKLGLVVETDLPATLPLLRADQLRTRQVLFNLIGNAMKFTTRGGRIEIRARGDPVTGLHLTVADTGIGISDEDLPRVLEPFEQVDGAVGRQHAGTGLGLPAVKAIMELHGGVLELTSVVGAGTEAAVVFPPARMVPAATVGHHSIEHPAALPLPT